MIPVKLPDTPQEWRCRAEMRLLTLRLMPLKVPAAVFGVLASLPPPPPHPGSLTATMAGVRQAQTGRVPIQSLRMPNERNPERAIRAGCQSQVMASISFLED